MNFTELISGKRSLIVGIIVVMLICIGYRAHKLEHREALHIDEVMSVVLSNCSTLGWYEPFVDDSRMFSGQEMKKAFYADDNSVSEVVKDLGRLWVDNRDNSHTNLYYSLLRVSFLGADTGEYSELMLRAWLLNMLLFLISFFFVLRFIRLLLDNNILIWSILLVAFMTPGAVYSTFSYRPYQLQETMFSVITYYAAVCFLQMYRGEVLKGKLQAAMLALMLAFGYMAGYFGVLYVLMLWSGLMLTGIIKRQKSNFLFLGAVLLLSCFFVMMLYPNFLAAWTSGRGNETMSKMAMESLNGMYSTMLKPIFGQMSRFFLGVDKLLFIILLLAVGVGYRYSKTRRIDINIQLCFWLAVVCFVWIGIVIFFSPWKGAHYFRPVFPVLMVAILVPLFATKIKLYYPLLVLLPLYFFWQLRILNIDEFSEQKGVDPIIFAGKSDYLEQYHFHVFFNDNRPIGFSFDRENFEKKMDELGGKGILAVVLDKKFENYIDENKSPDMTEFYKYVDTTKYVVTNKYLFHTLHTFFYLEPKIDSLSVTE